MPRASWAAVCQETARLEDELRQKEKRMLRLRQVFAAKTAESRETLSAILGVKVAFSDNGQVRVKLQYDLGAAFVFSACTAGRRLWRWEFVSGAYAARCAGRGRAGGAAAVDGELS